MTANTVFSIPGPADTFWHSAVRNEIFFLLRTWARETKQGDAFCETHYRIDSTWFRADVVYWDSEHLRTIDHDRTPIEIVPQLVVEVASPSESFPFAKPGPYLRAGVHTVWIVLRDPYEIHVFEKSGGRRVIRAGEKLEAPALLPGFSADPAIFLPR